MVRTAIIGSGNVGCDILAKVGRSAHLTCVAFVGRTAESPGLAFAARHDVRVYAGGVDELLEDAARFDLVFDATSARAHEEHAAKLLQLDKQIINLTPSLQGAWCVPAINGQGIGSNRNISMITCGGQASLPVLHALATVRAPIEYVEVVSSISAKSAGPATRRNIDQYLRTTEAAICHFTGCTRAKAILNINPAEPSVSMQTAVSAVIDAPDLERIRTAIDSAVRSVQLYVPGYQLLVEPYFDGSRIFTMIKVQGSGDFLPPYAGNLDIITCAAVRVAETIGAGRPGAQRAMESLRRA